MVTSPCTPWEGTHRAYDGRPVLADGRYAYRVLYEEQVGPIPPGHVLHHLCENVWCVNVQEHLRPITQGEHIAEHGLPGDNHQASKTECPQGHPYDDENTYLWNGERHCRRCRQEAKRRYRARKKVQA